MASLHGDLYNRSFLTAEEADFLHEIKKREDEFKKQNPTLCGDLYFLSTLTPEEREYLTEIKSKIRLHEAGISSTTEQSRLKGTLLGTARDRRK